MFITTFFQSLRSAAEEVKSCKDSRRRIVLREQLGDLNFDLEETPTPVPLSLGFEAKGIDVENSAYFPSNSYPIKVAFSARVTNKVRFALVHFYRLPVVAGQQEVGFFFFFLLLLPSCRRSSISTAEAVA